MSGMALLSEAIRSLSFNVVGYILFVTMIIYSHKLDHVDTNLQVKVTTNMFLGLQSPVFVLCPFTKTSVYSMPKNPSVYLESAPWVTDKSVSLL